MITGALVEVQVLVCRCNSIVYVHHLGCFQIVQFECVCIVIFYTECVKEVQKYAITLQSACGAEVPCVHIQMRKSSILCLVIYFFKRFMNGNVWNIFVNYYYLAVQLIGASWASACLCREWKNSVNWMSVFIVCLFGVICAFCACLLFGEDKSV